ncbi:ATP-dependent DNA helicase DinG [Friedmanniella endophytica]|uniref:ATP-dependent helicase DinG n=1 Tax=Microlunatus kandeliicorticis TaxID=1759536 RepID=A0A7W3IUC1_9ACTN|nr:ATP-dependent DNA helicase DinG [Microlunatus kandeliicorticis]
MTSDPTSERGWQAVLDAAVGEIGGQARPGQQAMAAAVADAAASGRHLLVQAGTGTGKSLGYLAPLLAELASRRRERAVVATATLALQRQLHDHDIPAALDAVEQVTGRRPSTAVLKGRSNYACRLRVEGDGDRAQQSLIAPDELVATARAAQAADGDQLSPQATSVLGAEVVALREWAQTEHERSGLADRDDAPSHSDRAWQQVSVPVRECLGVQRCPFGDTCFVERSREQARAADLVVTNHALLAIDAMHGRTALPEHELVVIDEAHEVVARVTGAASAELAPTAIDRVAKRAVTFLDDDVALDFFDAADGLRTALDDSPVERVEDPAAGLVAALALVRDSARKVVSQLTGAQKEDTERKQAAAAVQEVFDVAERMAKLDPYDVVWVAESERFGRDVRVAPLTVAGLMRDRVFGDRTVVMTSATLKLGDDFSAAAASVGLKAQERDDAETSEPVGEAIRWRGLDVGSPFDYRRQGIRYVARSLDRPGRDGLSAEALAEIAELIWASGGRTLGLFSSRRAAEAAARHVRAELPSFTVLCQGDAQLPELTRRFVAEEQTSLFGTLSLWQGIDVPGRTCQLVIIDRIPFPRPDEPLALARQRAVAEAGGNGFMAVAATHAALLLAQGAGRLIRRQSDRGVVAVLDSRLVTARYGSFLTASMPDMWPTTDREQVIQALRRLAAAADSEATAAAEAETAAGEGTSTAA